VWKVRVFALKKFGFHRRLQSFGKPAEATVESVSVLLAYEMLVLFVSSFSVMEYLLTRCSLVRLFYSIDLGQQLHRVES
jgi:hypothetical protein